MKLEHVALLVADPVAMADWYTKHLGMRVAREGDAPGHARFLAQDPLQRADEGLAQILGLESRTVRGLARLSRA